MVDLRRIYDWFREARMQQTDESPPDLTVLILRRNEEAPPSAHAFGESAQ